MNHTQIKYFLTAARCLNFTEAARQLFISQPALSQQITAIESELNMQLFIRYKKKLRLTPAALVLLEEMPAYERHYQEIIDKAKIAHNGNAGVLRIGVLQGQMLTEHFQEAFDLFRKKYLDVAIQLSVDTFRGLKRKLDNNKLDIAFSVDFDFKGDTVYLYEKVDINVGVALASKIHPLAGKRIANLSELSGENIILVDHMDTEVVRDMVINDCKKAGFIPNLLLASSLDEQMLWIDAGLGVGIINENSYIAYNPNICRLEGLEIGINYFVIAWHRDNMNPATALFSNFVTEYMKNVNI